MAGPLTGVGVGQQVPLNTTSNVQAQNNNGQVREQDERQPQQDQVQPQNAAAAQTQESNDSQDLIQQQIEELLANEGSEISNQNELQRGSVIDISV